MSHWWNQKQRTGAKQFWTSSETGHNRRAVRQSTTEATTARHTSHTTAQHIQHTSTSNRISRSSNSKPTLRHTSRHTRSRHTRSRTHTTTSQESSDCQNQSRQSRQARQDGFTNHLTSNIDDTSRQPSKQPYRHQSHTVDGQHQRQEIPHICQESGRYAQRHFQERSTKFGRDSNSIWSTYGQSPTNELQEFVTGSSCRSLLCHLTSWTAQHNAAEQYEHGEEQQVFEQLTELMLFRQFYLTEVPNVNKLLWTYTQGLISLALLFHFGARDQYTQQRIHWFQQMGVTPPTCKFEGVNQPHTVYIKGPAAVTTSSNRFTPKQMFYIESTKVDLRHREYNRHTQFNRYKQGKAIQVKLAIRWWASQNNYSNFTTIAVRHCYNYAEAWTYEHAIIQQLQAPLNFPLISKLLTRNAFKYYYKPDRQRLQGIQSRFRMFARIRRRLRTTAESNTTIPAATYRCTEDYVQFGIFQRTEIWDMQTFEEWSMYWQWSTFTSGCQVM